MDASETKIDLLQKDEEEKVQMQKEVLCTSNIKNGCCTHLYSPNEQDTNFRDKPNNIYNTFCLLCGEQFENKFKLSLHMLQDHSPNRRKTDESINQNYQFPLDALSSINLKVEKFQVNRTKTKEVCETVTSNKQISQELADEGKTSSILVEMSTLGVTAQSTTPTNSTTTTTTTTIQNSKYWPIFDTSAINSIDENNHPSNRGFNSEAFCDLCNKEFCNKYFLKTHKANKHGIYNPNMLSTNNCFNNSTVVGYNPLHTQNRQLNFFTNFQQECQQPPQTSVFDGDCRNPDMFSLKQPAAFDAASNFSEDESVTFNSMQMDKIRKMLKTSQNFIFEQEEFSFIPQPRKLSPRSEQEAREANFTDDKLKLLGIVNPDAFCNLCCKEYCNEYFLSAHKWKQHEEAASIHVDTDSAQKLSIWPFINTSIMPLNLIASKKDSYATKSKKRIKLELTEVNSNTEASTYSIENDDDNSTNPEEFTMDKESDISKLLFEDLTNKTSKESTRYQYIQKLQTMFQQIHNYNAKDVFSCPVCGIGTGNTYQLQLHLISEHNTNPESVSNTQIQIHSDSSKNSTLSLSKSHKELHCTQCEGKFTSLVDFQKHINHIHLIPKTESPQHEGLENIERSTNPAIVAPTSSYCDICNKELCNKYFMKTHMQRMHGIEIENGAQIGGVVCNICNKELCSKYFLRVHKHNTHGITDDISPLAQHHRQNGVNMEIGFSSQSQQKPEYNLQLQSEHSLISAEQIRQQIQIVKDVSNENVSLKITSPQVDTLDYTNQLCISQTTKIISCPICSKTFNNSMLLSSHIVSDHSMHSVIACEELKKLEQPFQLYGTAEKDTILSTAENNENDLLKFTQNLPKKTTIHSHNLKEYRCAVCPFTTLYYAFLFIHERTHYFFNSGISDITSSHINKEAHSLENVKDYQCKRKKTYLENSICNDDKSMSVSFIQSTDSIDRNKISKHDYSTTKTAQEDNDINDITEKYSNNGRSATSSPLSMTHQLMQDVSWKTGQIATYALPQKNTTNETQCDSIQMQAFEIEETKIREECNLPKTFLPAIVYLPVKERINSSVSVTFNLTPA